MVLHRQHKMKLKELLQKGTPGKWRAIENKAAGAGHKIYTTEGYDVVLGIMNFEDALLAAHAKNVLPGLVNAVREYTKERDYQNVAACKKDQDRLEKLLLAELTKAEEVEMENNEVRDAGPDATNKSAA